MLYKPENVVDLDTGAILNAEVRKADEADTEGLAERVVTAAALVEAIREEAKEAEQKRVGATVATLTADKGYYCVEELKAIQESGLRTVISDPLRNRRTDKLDGRRRAVVRHARRAARSRYGKALLRRRGMHIETQFCPHPGQRRHETGHALRPGEPRQTLYRSLRRPITFRS